MKRSLVLGLALLASAAAACRARSTASVPAERGTPLASSSAPLPAASAEAARLPEDPELGRKSTEQWREHLREEERERQLNYDRRKLAEHTAVVTFLRDARARYERATTKTTVLSVQQSLAREITRMRQRIEKKIDPWGNSSKLLGNYDALLNALSSEYPAARILALSGDPAPAAAQSAEFERHMTVISEWLEAANESEDE